MAGPARKPVSLEEGFPADISHRPVFIVLSDFTTLSMILNMMEKLVLVVLPGILLFGAGVRLLVLLVTPRSPEVGLLDGRLRPCPSSPNCVCSETEGKSSSYIEPLEYRNSDPVSAWRIAKEVLLEMGAQFVKEDEIYCRVIFRTRVFGFVDDLELRLDSANQRIHVRSASRVGYSDFGLNRRRVECLRSLLLKKTAKKKEPQGDG